MARKVTNTTQIADDSYLLSQTPKDYNKSNFFLKELQDKVNSEWRFRPNRVDVEYEQTWGANDHAPLEVVVQTVKKDTGVPYSDDFRRLVFKDIREKRFNIGNKFYFDPDYQNVSEDNKDTWLVTNISSITSTTSVVVQRCTGTLGSIVYKKDASGHDTKEIESYHYEPVIQGTELSSVGLFYNETAISPQSELIILVQHNQYTSKYYINQRFIIGYDKVYRVKAVNKFYSKHTNDPYDIGLMRVYLEITESSTKDDFVNRIAYQSDTDIDVQQDPDNENYSIKFSAPAVMPNHLTGTPVTFVAGLYQNDSPVIGHAPITFALELENLPTGVSQDKYLNINTDVTNTLVLSLKKIYLNGLLKVTANCSVSNKIISATFDLVVDEL